MKHAATKNERDRLLIEALIWRFGALSRARIHELTNLQRSDITRSVHELVRAGRLVQAGRADNPVGRKRVLLRLNEKRAFVVGVGFDDENVLAATMDLRLKARSFVSEPTRLDAGVNGLVQQLVSSAKKAIQEAGVDRKLLLGIGVSGSGVVNSRQGTVDSSSTINFLRDVSIGQIFAEEFGLPIVVENITRAKAFAERLLGAGEMAEDMIYVEYGRAGIGAGIIIDGKLFYGSGFAAGELGHTHMIEGGPVCKCGSFGCLEALAGVAALEARIQKAIAEGSGSEALKLAGGDPTSISGWTVLKAAHLGDKISLAIVEQAANYLGLSLANLVNMFNPSTLVLDRRLSYAGEGLLEQITRVVKRQALSHSTKNLVIRFGRFENEASVLGAGSIVVERHFEIPTLKPPRFMVESVAVPQRATIGAPGSIAVFPEQAAGKIRESGVGS